MAPNRVGTFKISNEMIVEHWPMLARLLFSRVVVTKAECVWHSRCIEYVGLSELFDELPEGVAPPEYEFVFRKSETKEGPPIVTLENVRRVAA